MNVLADRGVAGDRLLSTLPHMRGVGMIGVQTTLCSIEDCQKPAGQRGWCQMHYTRWRRHSDPLATKRPGFERAPSTLDDYVDRFVAKVDWPDSAAECWAWTGYIDKDGYGIAAAPEGSARAYRLSYVWRYGPIPDGLQIDHLCRNRACVHPEHLEAVTAGENVLRGNAPSAVNARLAHCFRGHEFTDANTYIYPSGRRRCQACRSMGEPCSVDGCNRAKEARGMCGMHYARWNRSGATLIAAARYQEGK